MTKMQDLPVDSVLVGTFTLEELQNNEDKKQIEKIQALTPTYKYIYSIEVKKNGRQALKIYLSTIF